MTNLPLAKQNAPSGIPVAEQVEALLKARTFELAAKYCDGDLILLDERWTVTITDLIQYVKENGFPSWVRTCPETFDGIYLLQSNSTWLVYEQERGKIYDRSRKTFDSYDHALAHVLQTYYMPTPTKRPAHDSNPNTQ
jgi:hypothetical protein